MNEEENHLQNKKKLNKVFEQFKLDLNVRRFQLDFNRVRVRAGLAPIEWEPE